MKAGSDGTYDKLFIRVFVRNGKFKYMKQLEETEQASKRKYGMDWEVISLRFQMNVQASFLSIVAWTIIICRHSPKLTKILLKVRIAGF